tara:strand:+ start:654 stop:872 length:219 start_codon:yes stop_codon:yes gene_type:complete
MDSNTPEASARAAVDAIADGNRAAAVDAINKMLYGKSAETLDNYADVLAKTYFAEPEATAEPETDETDNGND